MSNIVGDEPCPKCREMGRDKTGNHLMIFYNGNKYCNRCGYKEGKEVMTYEPVNVESLPFKALPDRKLNQKTCEHFGVRVGLSETTGEIVEHYYPVTKEGKVTGYKIRKLPKTFTVQGDMKGSVELFGQSVCPKGGKRLLITGGELDCLSAWQMLNEARRGAARGGAGARRGAGAGLETARQRTALPARADAARADALLRRVREEAARAGSRAGPGRLPPTRHRPFPKRTGRESWSSWTSEPAPPPSAS